ncbi:MAG: molybdopterin molybdenumtransferase MoeA, partial [Desulfurococcaceae archaeon]
MKALLELIDVGEAIRRLVDALSRTLHLDVETVNLTNAIGKVLAEEVYATIDRPGEDISAVDGYAVRSLDTVGASYYNPVELTASRSVKPGEKPAFPCIEPGVAVEVYTGTPIP